MANPHITPRNVARPVVLGAISLVVAALIVQVTRSGVDVFVLMFAGFLLLVIERTLGDWVAESVGAGPATAFFAGVAVLALIYMQTDSGRARASRFFTAAEERGYHTAYFKVADPKDRSPVADGVAASPHRLHQAGQAVPPLSGGAPPAAAVAAEPEARDARITRLRLDPEVAVAGRPVTFRVELGSESGGRFPPVEFSVDGRVIGTADSRNGVAKTSWSTSVPGQYVVRARLTGSFLGSGSSTTLNVLPGR